MKIETLVFFELANPASLKLVKATEFTLHDGAKFWTLTIIIDEDCKTMRPESRTACIQQAEGAIGSFVKHLNETYNGE